MKLYRLRCPTCQGSAVTKLPPVIRGKLLCAVCKGSSYLVEIQEEAPPVVPMRKKGKPVKRPEWECNACGEKRPEEEAEEVVHTVPTLLGARKCGWWVAVGALLLAATVAGCGGRPPLVVLHDPALDAACAEVCPDAPRRYLTDEPIGNGPDQVLCNCACGVLRISFDIDDVLTSGPALSAALWESFKASSCPRSP